MPGNGGGDGGPAGGSGVNAGMANASFLAQLAATTDEIVRIAKDLDTIDGFTHRSVVCEIDNVCGHTLKFETPNFDHGGFGSDLPHFSIEDQKTDVFGAGSSGLGVGVEGHITYGIDDGKGSTFTIHFDDPEVGDNSGDCRVDSAISNTYFTGSIIGNGNN